MNQLPHKEIFITLQASTSCLDQKDRKSSSILLSGHLQVPLSVLSAGHVPRHLESGGHFCIGWTLKRSPRPSPGRTGTRDAKSVWEGCAWEVCYRGLLHVTNSLRKNLGVLEGKDKKYGWKEDWGFYAVLGLRVTKVCHEKPAENVAHHLLKIG